MNVRDVFVFRTSDHGSVVTIPQPFTVFLTEVD